MWSCGPKVVYFKGANLRATVYLAAVMQHLQYGIKSPSKFAITPGLPLLRGTLKHIIVSRAFS